MAAVCALDVGTTRIKALRLGEAGPLEPLFAAPSVLDSPEPGAVEVDAEALWARTLGVLRDVAAVGPAPAALAITNQRATVFLLDAAGAPLAPGLSWQDTRGAEALAAWLVEVGAATFARVTGLVPSTLWSLAKILWWRAQSLPAGARLATVQDWLLRRLGAREWLLDQANASLTGLLNVHSLAWDGDLVRAAGLSPQQLPSLAPSGVRAGALSPQVAAATGLQAGTPLILGGGDQQCAALGAGALQPGVISLNLGTAAVVSAPVDRVVVDPGARLVCLAHVVPRRWVLEGLQNTYGSADRWGHDLLGEDLADLAAAAPVGSRGLVCLPYLAGSGAPDYDPRARGALLGLALAHGRSDVARAILEGTSVELVRILDAAREFVAGVRLVASGGGALAGLRVEMLANLAGLPVAVAPHAEAGLVGAGLLAWVGLGRWPDAGAAAAALPPPGALVLPDPAQAPAYRHLHARYRAALDGLRRGGLLSPSWEEGRG